MIKNFHASNRALFREFNALLELTPLLLNPAITDKDLEILAKDDLGIVYIEAKKLIRERN